MVKPFKSGCGRAHVAVLDDCEASAGDVHPVISAHLRHRDIAVPDAHDYHSPDPDDRPISVNRIDPSIDLEDLLACERKDMDAIVNLGTYIGDYLARGGRAELFDRKLDDLMFRAVIWTTDSQMIRFSKGANKRIDTERDDPSWPRSDPAPTTDDADR